MFCRTCVFSAIDVMCMTNSSYQVTVALLFTLLSTLPFLSGKITSKLLFVLTNVRLFY